MLHSLETSLRRETFSERVQRSALAIAPKLKLSAPGFGVAAEVNLTALRGRAPDDLLLYLPFAAGSVTRLASPRPPRGAYRRHCAGSNGSDSRTPYTGDWALVDPELAAWVGEMDGDPPRFAP